MEGEDLGRHQNQIKRNNAEIVNGKTTWPRYGEMEPRLAALRPRRKTNGYKTYTDSGSKSGDLDRGEVVLLMTGERVWHNTLEAIKMTIGAGTVEDKMLIRTTNREDGGKPATALATDTGPVKVAEMDNGLLTGGSPSPPLGGAMTMANGNGGNDRTRLLPPPLQLWMTGENQNTLTSCNAGEAHPLDQPEPIPVMFTR